MTPLNDAATRLLALLPADGSPRPNAELREQLGVSESEYWLVRNGLIDEGRVVKSPGRGGRTALVVGWDSDEREDPTKVVTALIWVCFIAAGLLVAGAGVTGLVSRGSEGLGSLLLTLAFGAVTVAAVGVSLLIYRVQTRTARNDVNGQARILSRLEALVRQAASSAADTRIMVSSMQPAVDALAAVKGSDGAGHDASAQGESLLEEPESDAESWEKIRLDHGEFYRPGAIPMQVLSDLVTWWSREGESGRWPLSKLIGGYRQLNAAGTLKGVPWVLTFDDGDGGTRSFRLAYSGRQKGPAISELADDGHWKDFPDVD